MFGGPTADDVLTLRTRRNVPGVALYFTGLNQLRSIMATSPYFAAVRTTQPASSHGSTLPKLTSQGNLLAGATARVTVGFILNPFSVLKARYEVRYVSTYPNPLKKNTYIFT